VSWTEFHFARRRAVSFRTRPALINRLRTSLRLGLRFARLLLLGRLVGRPLLRWLLRNLDRLLLVLVSGHERGSCIKMYF
jgi:hypothetical protein